MKFLIFVLFFPICDSTDCSFPQSFATVMQGSLSERRATREMLQARITIIQARMTILRPFCAAEPNELIGRELDCLAQESNALLMAIKQFREE